MQDGRIIKGVGGLYTINTKKGVFLCKPRGIFRKDNITPLIGDFVRINEDESTIDVILDRKNELVRPRVSNVDCLLLVVSVKDPLLNQDLIDKFLILAKEKKIEVLICVNKRDLGSTEKIVDEYSKVGYKVLSMSISNNDIAKDEIYDFINGKTCVLAGPSGAGKSSLANIIFKNKVMETGFVSEKTKRGKHTTRHAEILEVAKDTYIVDSPGFTSISISHINKMDLQDYFIDFIPYLGQCAFNNCLHNKEPNCVIKQKVSEGEIFNRRYISYLSCLNELALERKN